MCAQVLKFTQPESNRCRDCCTRSACWAKGVSDEQIGLLPDYLTCVGSLAAGEHIYRAHDNAHAQFHIRSGMVKTYVISAAGDITVTGFYLPGEVVGCVHEDQRYAEFAQALQTTTLCRLDDNALDHYAQAGLASTLYRHLAHSLSVNARHQINLQQTSARARVAGFLVSMMQRLETLGRDPNYVATPMSRTDLASYLGMTLESLSRVLSKLQAGQVIKAKREAIAIVDPQSLRDLADHLQS